MNKFGVMDERVNQIKKNYGGSLSDEEVQEIVDCWGVDAINKGYEIFDFDGTGMLEIETIGDVGAFDGDDVATEQAIKDGVKIIPVEELPINFERRYLGWIDTPDNRKAIENYCKGE